MIPPLTSSSIHPVNVTDKQSINVDWDETLSLPPPRVQGHGDTFTKNGDRYLQLEILAHDLFEITLPSDVNIGDIIDVNDGHGRMKEIIINHDHLLVSNQKLVVDFYDDDDVKIPKRPRTTSRISPCLPMTPITTSVVETTNYVDTRSPWTCGLCWSQSHYDRYYCMLYSILYFSISVR